MRSYKKFALIILAVLCGFLLYNVTVWKLFTENIMSAKEFVGGDLARMGYVHGVKHFRKHFYDLPIRHVEQEDFSGGQVDLITIGDSFSNGGGGGRNRYYQDYIASINNISVMNIRPFAELDFLTIAAVYANNGYFDKIKPRALIISSSEKLCVERFSGTVNFERNVPLTDLTALKRLNYGPNNADITSEMNDKQLVFINEGNFKFPLYTLYYYFSDNAFFSKTYKVPLKAPLFSVKDSSTLLFYRDDIRNISRATQNALVKTNDNLNRLADKLASKGIKLYFMPCVDKYNLYSEFIVNNQYPQSSYFELLRPLPKRYTLIDTKAILQSEVKNGVKDIFYADDTHWSWKASAKIFETVRFN